MFGCLSSASLARGEGFNPRAACERALIAEYQKPVQEFVDGCLWKNNVKPREPHFTLNCGQRGKLQIFDKKIVRAGITNLFKILPHHRTYVKDVERLSANRMRLKYKYAFKDRPLQWKTVTLNNLIDKEDLELVQLSQSEYRPFEVARWRIYFLNKSDHDYAQTEPIRGTAFQVQFGPLEIVARDLRTQIFNARLRHLEVRKIEIVHTHPYETIMFEDENQHLHFFMNALSNDPPYVGDIVFADHLQKLMPKVPIVVTAIVGVEENNLVKMSYEAKRP